MAYISATRFSIIAGSKTIQTLNVEDDGWLKLMFHSLQPRNCVERLDFDCEPDPETLASFAKALLDASFAVQDQVARLRQEAKPPEQVAAETAAVVAEVATRSCGDSPMTIDNAPCGECPACADPRRGMEWAEKLRELAGFVEHHSRALAEARERERLQAEPCAECGLPHIDPYPHRHTHLAAENALALEQAGVGVGVEG